MVQAGIILQEIFVQSIQRKEGNCFTTQLRSTGAFAALQIFWAPAQTQLGSGRKKKDHSLALKEIDLGGDKKDSSCYVILWVRLLSEEKMACEYWCKMYVQLFCFCIEA